MQIWHEGIERTIQNKANMSAALVSRPSTHSLHHQYVLYSSTLNTSPPDATYSIDPNEGRDKDSLEVVCRTFEQYEGWFSCIKPANSVRILHITYMGLFVILITLVGDYKAKRHV